MKETKNLTPIAVPAMMPSPPEFLIKKSQTNGAMTDDAFRFEKDIHQGRSYSAPEPRLPKNVDFLVYQSALDDRRNAETTYAEIYSQYLEVVAFNEKLLRSLRTFERFKARVRTVYEKALSNSAVTISARQAAQTNLLATERALADSALENETLRANIAVHEEAYRKLIDRIGEGEAAMEAANRHFDILAQEYENRGILLDESDRKIREYVAQMQQMSVSIQELHEKNVLARDENLILQTQNRELQLREAGVSILNSEMAASLTKAQKQIHQLEEKLRLEREQYEARLAVVEDDLERYQEERRATQLIGLARNAQTATQTKTREPVAIAAEITQALAKPVATSGPNSKTADRAQWNEFYNKWTQIIGELTTHSTPMHKLEKNQAALDATGATPVASSSAKGLMPDVTTQTLSSRSHVTNAGKTASSAEGGQPETSDIFAEQWAEISDLEIL